MKSDVETRLEGLIQAGKYATTDVVIAEIVYAGFIKPGSADFSETIENFAEKFLEMIRIMPHPSINPVNDEFLALDSEDGPNSLRLYIKENMSVLSRQDMDNTKDVAIISAPFGLILINILPFFDCPELTIQHAIVQTKFYREEIKEEI